MTLRVVAALAALTLVSACGGKDDQEADAPPPEMADSGAESGMEGGAEASAAGAESAVAQPAAFAQCAACHSVEPGKNGIGPSLAGVYGAKAGHVTDYAYSPAMQSSGLTWDEATLNAYLKDPQGEVPGTKMTYAGLKDDGQRQQVIDYLKTLK